MASVIKTFSFNGTTEGWSFSSANGYSQYTTQSAPGDIGGSFLSGVELDVTNELGEYTWTGTFADLGVPAGATISGVSGNYMWYVPVYDAGGTSSTGTLDLYINNVLIGKITDGGINFNTTTPTWSSAALYLQILPAGVTTSSPVKLVLKTRMTNTDAPLEILIDKIQIQTTYSGVSGVRKQAIII